MKLEETKLFLRVIHNDEDSLIIRLIDSAESYIRSSFNSYIDMKTKDKEMQDKILLMAMQDKRTDILINMLVAQLYENRSMLVDKAMQNPIFTNFLWQIKGDLMAGDFND
ncbi:hypothetical protein AZF37_09770 (plasmid) [endosymbiont 'TC1' of Trimyema compressum]|uniref:head-tail connector protein n=1 Tax=endosymbiont 'TC1' of Trimyema compressum TaxID=243899 RepID=UPI0007F0C3BD|nr:head-tail connector protein [endosymbiont 'TC1' of Trimyema compressum]AMP21461.1 hypothetical protein AZF37_09770 [endosymbiont 'TC1' of Trimyema compressum]